MIRSVSDLKRFDLVATDGSVGSIDDFLFDDARWAIRYVVVDTGKWLPGRRVLISPIAIASTEWGEQRMRLSLTRADVASSPDVDTHQPISRQYEIDYFNHYGYPYYWSAGALWGATAHPMVPTPEQLAAQRAATRHAQQRAAEKGDAHLRSATEVTGYRIRATDGELGHVDDLLFDDLSWAVRYLVVDTSNWWFGKHVLVAPSWIDTIEWADRSVSVDLTRQSLKEAPAYDRAEHVDRQWEAAYYGHLQEPGYWIDEDEARAIKEAQAYLREEPAVPDPLERRSRPR